MTDTPAAASVEETTKDSVAVLAGTSPAFDHEIIEGVDLSSMPALQDFSKLLPSKLARVAEKTMEVAKLAREKKISTADSGSSFGDFDGWAEMIEKCEVLLLANAKDESAMSEWLVSQQNPFGAVMAGFARVGEALGKLDSFTK